MTIIAVTSGLFSRTLATSTSPTKLRCHVNILPLIAIQALVTLASMNTKVKSNRISQTRLCSPANPYIFTKKTVWMQRVARTVSDGATLYIQGSTRLENVAFKAVEFHKRFRINEAKHRAIQARKQGNPVNRWFAWTDHMGLVHWVLLHEPGTRVDATEKWCNVVDDRIKSTGYELVRRTREGSQKPAWTWRYTREQEHALRDALVAAIRQRQDIIVIQLIHTMHSTPGFAGAREQVKKWFALLRSEWTRSRKKSEVMPPIPSCIGYVRALKEVGSTWSELMKKESQNGDP
jgi:hypothetical protein